MLGDTIREQLNTAEIGLLSALRSKKNLATYHTRFAKLLDTISLSTSAGRLDTSTATLAHNVAIRVESIADCLAEIELESRGLRDRLHDGWRDLLAKLPISANRSKAFHSQEATAADGTALRSPDYLPPAYKWLLANLHNPYPTIEIKESIASQAACSGASINSWFISVRRRVGWTSICREHFRNCRADAVDAAYHVLVKGDLSRAIPPEVAEAFFTMKKTAEALYTPTFVEGALTTDPKAVVKGVVESENSHSDESSKDPREPGRLAGNDEDLLDLPLSRQTSYRYTADSSYPSSRSPSPVPTMESSFSSETGNTDDVNPPVIAGQKRCIASSDGPDLDCGTQCVRKRRRISTLLDHNAEVASCNVLPLTRTTGDESLADSPKAFLQATSILHRTRKRRLSDVDRQSYSKRPQGALSGPRIQAVSDPLPKSSATESSIGDWFNINFPDIFDVPPPVDVEELDPSALWQVEMFSDYRVLEAPREQFRKDNSTVTATSCPPAYTSRPMIDAAASEKPGFSFPQSDDCLRGEIRMVSDLDGSRLIAAPLSDIDLSPLGVCSEPVFPTDTCDFLGSALSQSLVTVEDYDSQGVDLYTARTPTWMNTFSEPLQSSSPESSYSSAIPDSQLYWQLSSRCS